MVPNKFVKTTFLQLFILQKAANQKLYQISHFYSTFTISKNLIVPPHDWFLEVLKAIFFEDSFFAQLELSQFLSSLNETLFDFWSAYLVSEALRMLREEVS